MNLFWNVVFHYFAFNIIFFECIRIQLVKQIHIIYSELKLTQMIIKICCTSLSVGLVLTFMHTCELLDSYMFTLELELIDFVIYDNIFL